MNRITDSFLEKLEEQLDELTESQIDKTYGDLEKKQTFLNSYIEATQEIFEDEEEYIELAKYFHLIMNRAFEKTYGEIEQIPADFIEKKDNELISLWEPLIEKDNFFEEAMVIFEAHPQSDLFFYLYDNIFDDDDDLDDSRIELGTQLLLFTYGMVDIYNSFIQENEKK